MLARLLRSGDDQPLRGVDVAATLRFDTLLDLMPSGSAAALLALDDDDDESHSPALHRRRDGSHNRRLRGSASTSAGGSAGLKRPALSHDALRRFVAVDFPRILRAAGLCPDGGDGWRGGVRPRIATLMPNGPEAAAVLVG
jgi:hypothetical protein